MSENCKASMKAAVKGAFSDAEIDAIAERLTQKRLRARAKGAATPRAEIRAAASELAVDEVKSALVSQRARALSERAKAMRKADMAKMTGSGFDRLEALTIGSDKAGFGGHDSVENHAAGLKSELVGDVERALRAEGLWQRVTHGLIDQEFEARIVNDMAHYNGSKSPLSGDDDAAKVARILNASIEKGRQMQNGAGAWIGRLDGYVVRQTHDAIKVSGGFWNKADQGAAKAAWVQFIQPLLDDATFGDRTGAARTEFLERAWTNIVSGVHEVVRGENDIEGFLPSSGTARQASAERVLHFKSPDDWLKYHKAYGAQGGIVSAVAKDLGRAADNTALMTRFGPNPEVAWRNEVAAAIETAAKAGDAKQVAKLGSKEMQAAFDAVSGMASAPESLRLAQAGQVLRAHQRIAKLGGMVLSAFADMPVAATAMMRAGVPFLEAYGSAFRGILRLEGDARKEAGAMLGVMAKSAIGQMTSGVNARDGALGFYSYVGRKNMELQGFSFWNDGLRSGVGNGFAHHLGRHADRAFDALPVGLQRTLSKFGIDATGWDRMRTSGAAEINGDRFIFADGLAPGDAVRLRAMVQDIMDAATSEARGREQRGLTAGIAAGTAHGEAVRLMGQFMSFPVTYVNRSLAPAVKDAFTGGPVMPLVNLILGTALFGYLSMQAKEIAKGREPRPVTPKTVLAALAQGGGFGIYGDFLFGEKTRMGGGLETFLGPTAGDFMQLVNLGKELRDGIWNESPEAAAKARKNAGVDAFKFTKSQIPLVNLWYTRAALDYLIFWRMQEAIDPGWAGRYQRRVEKENGTEFWLKPTEAVQ